MKTTLTVCILIILALAGVIAIGFTELYKQTELDRKEIEGLRNQLKSEKDSLTKAYNKREEVFQSVLDSISDRHEETLKSELASKREIKKLREIVFIQYSDSSRIAELKKLYKSYKP